MALSVAWAHLPRPNVGMRRNSFRSADVASRGESNVPVCRRRGILSGVPGSAVRSCSPSRSLARTCRGRRPHLGRPASRTRPDPQVSRRQSGAGDATFLTRCHVETPRTAPFIPRLCLGSKHSSCPITTKDDKSRKGHLHHCDRCDYKTRKPCDLRAHIRVHTGDKPFQCPSCSQCFSKKGTLDTHLRVHTGERPFKCHLCPQSFSHRNALKHHLRAHLGVRPYQCPSCPRTFVHGTQLNAHLRIHTGERPYQCPSCPRTFMQRSHLTVHLRIHSGERPYRCAICSRSFVRSSTLNKHKKTQHCDNPE